MNITTKDGLLFRDGVVINLPEADEIARLHGYLHAEQMVRALKVVSTDERENLPSASGIPRLVHCAGSRQAEVLFPGEEQTEVATSGTAIHAALETGLDENLAVSEKDVAENMRKIEEQAILAWKQSIGADGVPSIHREQRLWIRDRKTLKLIASAKPDVVAVDGVHALALDFKSGFLDTESADANWQLKTQALAVWHEYPEVTHVRVGIIQHRFGSKYDPCDYTLEDLKQAEAELKFYLHLAAQAGAPRVPGKHCRYCRARGACPEANAMALIPNISVPVTDKKQVFDRVSLLNVNQLAAIRERKTLIEAILDAVDSRMKQLPAEELATVGLELKPNSPMRTLPDIQKVYELLKRENLLEDDAEFRTLCKVSIGAIEELTIPRIQKKLGGGSVKDADAELVKLLAPIVVPSPKSPSLKPIKPKK